MPESRVLCCKTSPYDWSRADALPMPQCRLIDVPKPPNTGEDGQGLLTWATISVALVLARTSELCVALTSRLCHAFIAYVISILLHIHILLPLVLLACQKCLAYQPSMRMNFKQRLPDFSWQPIHAHGERQLCWKPCPQQSIAT